jgi:hypothetical protein
MNPSAYLAAYKQKLSVARGELMTAKAAALPYVETSADANEDRKALAAVARGVVTVAGVLIRIIDSLPGPEPT